MDQYLPTRVWIGVLLIGSLLLTGCNPFKNDDDDDNGISDVFVFGDSLSDTGNVFLGTDGDIPVSPPYFEGRFANGPVWVEILAEALGLEAEPALASGTNFAVGAARASRDVAFIVGGESLTVPGILSQVNLFFGSQTDLFDRFKDFFIKRDQADEDALYAIFIGSDDVRDIVLGLNGGVDAATTIRTAIANISEAIRKLEDEGARRFLVLNVPNLGLLPETVARGLDAVMLATDVTNAFNTQLQTALDTLEDDLDLTIFRLDAFALLQEIAENPESFDLTNATEPCLAGESPEFEGGTPCATPDAFLFWDLLHASTKVHAILAERALTAISTLTTQ